MFQETGNYIAVASRGKPEVIQAYPGPHQLTGTICYFSVSAGLLDSHLAYNGAMTHALHDRQILTISQLNRRTRQLLETHFSLLWVRGEVSNLSRPSSGHWYFTLKDRDAQIRCAMFRTRNSLVATPPRDGDQVVVRGRVSLYENRGDFQLIAEHLEPDGAGLLQQRFEELKKRLAAEGLFSEERKRQLPDHPARIGVITSPTGAAIRDILHVLARRAPWIPIALYPAAVQGREAPQELLSAIEMANQDGRCEVLVLARGGGSIEDLWAFNDEQLARAIVASRLPIVSAVGHETDFTIADFVADWRAPTPSAAAELISPDGAQLLAQFEQGETALALRMRRRLAQLHQQLVWLGKRLRSPADQLREQAQHLDHLEIRLVRAIHQQLAQYRARLSRSEVGLQSASPSKRYRLYRLQLDNLEKRLTSILDHQLGYRQARLRALAATLHAVSPLATLDRGYAIARDADDKVVRTVATVVAGDPLRLMVADGDIFCTVDTTVPGTER